MTSILTAGLLGAIAAASITSAQAAPITFSGIDTNGSNTVALASTPNADAARGQFFSNLSGVGTETFETLSGSSPLNINFGVAGTATLTGPGSVQSVPPGSTNGFGRYSISSATSSRFYEATAGRGGIGLTFSTPIAAFGFYGIDVGDFNGTIILQLTDTLGKTLDLTVPTPGVVAANGSVLYYGFYDTAVQYTNLSFITAGSAGGTTDVFAFDNFSIGGLSQVTPTAVPEPMSIALFGAGLAGLAMVRRRKA